MSLFTNISQQILRDTLIPQKEKRITKKKLKRRQETFIRTVSKRDKTLD